MNNLPSVAESAARRWLRGSYAGLLLIIGLTLAGGGGVLLLIDGGSFYYFFAGLAISASAILVGRRDLRGRWLYGVVLTATVAWAIWEVGFDAWGLVARRVAASEVPFTMGVPNIGGPITTRSGLVFSAATAEQAIRAYDVRTGQELWKARLPGGGQATPLTYRSARSGRQFVVIAAGGKPKMSKLGTKIVAYALP